MKVNLDLGDTRAIIDYAKGRGVLRNQLACILGNCYHETAHTMKPVKEAYWVKNAEEWRKKNLRYWPWYGRGHIQITWEDNYRKAGRKLGVDLTTNPDAVMKTENSVAIAVRGCMEGWFTGKKVGDYVTLQKSGFFNARAVVNGDKNYKVKGSNPPKKVGTMIADYAKAYDAALKAEGYGEATTAPTPPSGGTDPQKPKTPPKSGKTGGMAGIVALIVALLGLLAAKFGFGG